MIYRKFKICERNLNLAAQQLYRMNGSVPTRREAAEWFRDWADKQSRTYSIHPLLMWSALLIGLMVGAAPLSLVFEMLGIEAAGVPGVLVGICALAGGVGSLLLLGKAYGKYESYKWERLIERGSSESLAWIANGEAMRCVGIRRVRGEYCVGGERFGHLNEAIEHVRRTRV